MDSNGLETTLEHTVVLSVWTLRTAGSSAQQGLFRGMVEDARTHGGYDY